MPKCPHCGFDMSIDILVKGTTIHARWHCLRCDCFFRGEPTMEWIAGRKDICPEVVKIMEGGGKVEGGAGKD